MRIALRSRHYSKRTEQTYVHWIKRYIFFHKVRHSAENETRDLIAKHIEVQVSFDPVSYLSNKSAKSRTDEEVICDMTDWVKKKFDSGKIAEIRKSFYQDKWSYCFIHGVLKDQRELAYLRQSGIETIEFAEVIDGLCSSHPRDLPFTGEAKDIVELLRYAKNMEKA